ncbi:Clp protease N-terminal domain-containing protein [Mycobacterium sp. GA-2829]|uniref:Clp protease N-terminal domain-containing protein n=1 Tax=Mycobacterium sp. GA-2829 TaxID=1772283 RepID=UPI000A48F78A|nr:Clp protease N-terminal domain-containing protein [Mycobacterium sp. GA-2829]
MFDRYTDAARRVVLHAIAEAAVRTGGTVHTEHLLMALLSEDVPATTRSVWRQLGVSHAAIQSAAPAMPARVDGVHGRVSYSARARRALERAYLAATSHGLLVSPEHLLVTVLEYRSSGAAALLTAIGVDPDAVRRHIAATEPPEADPGLRRTIRLCPDYGCEWPLWEHGPLTPDALGISAALAEELRRWTAHWEEHFHAARGWRDPAHRASWHQWGHRLAGRLQAELQHFADVVPRFDWAQ